MRAMRTHQVVICGRRKTKYGLKVGLGVGFIVAGMSGLAYAEPSGTESWVQATDQAAWSERQGHAAVSFAGKLWVLGGVDAPGTKLNDVWYSTDGITWTLATASAPWAARGAHGAVVFDDKMWVLGGWEALYSEFNDVWCSLDGVNWDQVTESAEWSARYGPKPVVFDGKIWVLGGRASGTYKNDVWYSEDGATWTLATSDAGWPPNASGGSAVFNGQMWVMGGWSPPAHRDEVWSSYDGETWSLVTSEPGWWPRGSLDPVAADGMLWIMGGNNDQTWPDIVFNDVWTTPDGANWAEHISSPADWPARGNHRTVVYCGRIWVLGGKDQQAGTCFNDVWYLPLGGAPDSDTDGIPDDCDNCPDVPNGPDLGTCVQGTSGTCLTDEECGTDGLCSINQENFDGDDEGDVCDDDIDNDGVNNVDNDGNRLDACNYTPLGAANIIMDPESCLYGTIRRDLDGDCDCDLADFARFADDGLTGPNP